MLDSFGTAKSPGAPCFSAPAVGVGGDERVNRVSCCGVAGFGSCGGDVALRRSHRFVAEQFHQGVDANVGASQFCGVRVPQAVNQGARNGLGVRPSAFESPFNARLQRSTGDRSPSRPTNSADRADHRERAESGRFASRLVAA